MPTFKAIVDTSAKRKDGTMNVKIRVTHQRKTLKVATSIYVDSTQVTRSGKFKDERVIDMCEDIVRKWRKLASQLGTAEELEVADVVRFIREVEKRESFSLDFIAYGRKVAEGMNKGTARTYTTALNALCRFVGSDKLDIRHITVRFLEEFEKAGMKATGMNPETGLVEAVEVEGHPWFVGVQFHPEYKSTVKHPHPLFVGFVAAAIKNKNK